MIAANGQRVAVARNHPDAEFGIGGFDSRRNRRRASVDAVKAVSVHVVRKSRRTANAGNKNHLFARNAQVRHNLLHVVEDRVVAAARAPAHFLVRHEVFLVQLSRRWRYMKHRRAAFAFRRDCRFDDRFVSVAA